MFNCISTHLVLVMQMCSLHKALKHHNIFVHTKILEHNVSMVTLKVE